MTRDPCPFPDALGKLVARARGEPQNPRGQGNGKEKRENGKKAWASQSGIPDKSGSDGKRVGLFDEPLLRGNKRGVVFFDRARIRRGNFRIWLQAVGVELARAIGFDPVA